MLVSTETFGKCASSARERFDKLAPGSMPVIEKPRVASGSVAFPVLDSDLEHLRRIRQSTVGDEVVIELFRIARSNPLVLRR